ncbi:DNA primase [Solibacillus sp. R5-41]|uniref:DNA primase n=1 Tax=Solibacillus sp. R5-41 TaxID=2048654 RepID=UPI000C12908A|nr:DNA primase [Solibacillus sp. R5-41]ATP39482.1 DNA primase [Solibacillus sp. R5-41]
MAGKIPEHVIEQIRSQSDIVDVISDYMQLTKRGRNWFGLCPFHGEQTPSFSVSQEKQIFHCFGCGAGGNAITFVMDIEHIAFPDALIKLGDRAGIPLDVQVQSELTTSNTSYSKKEEMMREGHAVAAEFYHHLLMNTEDGELALNYLLERGFTREQIETHQIGWALPNWDTLSILLERKGFLLEVMAECGLIIQKESDQTFFDRFRGRIMFPIRDENGKAVAFSGRILNKNADEAKYLNSPETPIFHKSQVLYNLDKARASIRKTRHAVLMEGFVDVLAANRAGVYNAVATMGTSLTPQHITKLKRLVQQITICYDGDNAGFEAAKRASQMLHEERIKVEVAVLPNKLDPDDYIQNYGQEAFKNQIIEKPHAYIAFMMMHAKRGKNFQFENDTLQYIQEVLETLKDNSSPTERDLYIRQLSNETNISQEAISAQLRKVVADGAKEQKRNQNALKQPIELVQQKLPKTATDRAERLLLAHMLHDVNVVNKVLKLGNTAPFIHEEYLSVFVRLVGFYEEYEMADFQRFVEVLNDNELRKIVMEAAYIDRDPENGEAEISDCLKHIEKHRIEIEIEKLTHNQKEAEKMHEHRRALEIAQQIIQLRRSVKGI